MRISSLKLACVTHSLSRSLVLSRALSRSPARCCRTAVFHALLRDRTATPSTRTAQRERVCVLRSGSCPAELKHRKTCESKEQRPCFVELGGALAAHHHSSGTTVRYVSIGHRRARACADRAAHLRLFMASAASHASSVILLSAFPAAAEGALATEVLPVEMFDQLWQQSASLSLRLFNAFTAVRQQPRSEHRVSRIDPLVSQDFGCFSFGGGEGCHAGGGTRNQAR
eukprot:3133743-Rhodomonas_salina.4